MESQQILKFKIATEDWEFDLLHALNYKTFVEEIPQHEKSNIPKLVDKFHKENTYIICLDGRILAGMIAIRGKRPFSLDTKLKNLDSYLPTGHKICEIRLLAVEKPYRNGYVFRGLVELLVQYGLAQGYNLAIISGTTRQLKLYHHLGFVPFGPLVGSAGAEFQPMFLTLESFVKKVPIIASEVLATPKKMISFLPGPVTIHDEVQTALGQPPISHRSDAFLSSFQIIKQTLRELTGIKNVEILVGSGTLANDVVCAQISLENMPGLILRNGEFGERLVDHAQRMGLNFLEYQVPYGQTFTLEQIEDQFKKQSNIRWLWMVHCETSTGVVNDLDGISKFCKQHQIKLCVDCISSLGTIPVNLQEVFLASGVSGKGFSAFPGLSIVFYNHKIKPSNKLPRYLDLGYYASCEGIPFTHSSNLVMALQTAMRRFNPKRFTELADQSNWLRNKLVQNGWEILAAKEIASPAVFTIVLPQPLNSKKIALYLQKAGFLVSYGSEYLMRRNWIQICLMGEFTINQLEALLAEMNKARASMCHKRNSSHVASPYSKARNPASV